MCQVVTLGVVHSYINDNHFLVMISSDDIDALCAYIHSTNIWTQKVSDWFKECGPQPQNEHVKLESELTHNIGLASEIIKCTLEQVNEDGWSVETWKDKLKSEGKSFDMTLKVTFNYLLRVLEGTQLNVVGAWELLKRHKIAWVSRPGWVTYDKKMNNTYMNPEYDGSNFYFDLEAALEEYVATHITPARPTSARVVVKSDMSTLLLRLKNI